MKLAITNATLIDGTGSDPIEQTTVVVEDARITSVKKQGGVPRGAQVIDGAGMTLMPGLIDTHVHMTQNGFDINDMLMTAPALRLYRAIPHLQATLDGGVTTVRDAGYSPLGLKLAVQEKLFPGPRMQVAITILSQTGGHGDKMMPSGCCLDVLIPDVPPGVVDGVEEMRKRVREILRAGADWIKVCATGGVLSPTDMPASSQFTIEEIAAAVAEGQAHGNINVMAHAQGTRGIKNAIRAGCKSIEHGIWLDDEAIAMMKANDVYLVPTLVAPLQVLRRAEAHPGTMPAYAVQKSRAVIVDHQASFNRAVAAGVKIAMGTDSGVGPHGENAEELSLMVDNGMTPMQAIVASTQSAATLMGLAHEIGTVAVGKQADLILVNGDPLANIHILHDHDNISMVMQGGSLVKNRLAAHVTTKSTSA